MPVARQTCLPTAGTDPRSGTPRRLADGTVLRPLSGDRSELEACVALQRAIWGPGFSDVASPQILRVVQAMGGVAAAAFEPDGEMLGFVFGITGLDDGRPLHWSHMLAVLPKARGRDLGYHLKLYQRERLLPLGVDAVRWTFDPLVAKNAHLNLVRLGANVLSYECDYYGSGEDSTLSAGLGTDRFIVEWRLREPPGDPAPRAGALAAERSSAPVLNVSPDEESPEAVEPPAAPVVRIRIPIDIQDVRRERQEAAAGWRASTRAAFLAAVERGYRVVTVYREPAGGHAYYVLQKGAP